MNIFKFVTSALSIGALALSLSTTANAFTVSLTPTIDGQVQTFGGVSIDTADNKVSISRSGPSLINGVLEFDLSTIADGSTINSVSLEITLAAIVSNFQNRPAEVDIFAVAGGDGAVTVGDYGPGGTQVFDGTILSGFLDSSPGQVHTFNFSSITPVVNSLLSDALTIRLETNDGATIQFVSLEGVTVDWAAATLNINYSTPATVPVPTALPLFGTGLAIMGFVGWRRKQHKSA